MYIAISISLSFRMLNREESLPTNYSQLLVIGDIVIYAVIFVDSLFTVPF